MLLGFQMFFFPAPFRLAILLADRGGKGFVVAFPLHRAAGRETHGQMEGAQRDLVRHGGIYPGPLLEKIRGGMDRIARVDHIPHAHILQQHEHRDPAINDPGFQAGLALEKAELVRLRMLRGRALATHLERVDDHPLRAWIEIQPPLPQHIQRLPRLQPPDLAVIILMPQSMMLMVRQKPGIARRMAERLVHLPHFHPAARRTDSHAVADLLGHRNRRLDTVLLRLDHIRHHDPKSKSTPRIRRK